MMSSHILVRWFGVGFGIAHVVLVFGVVTWLAIVCNRWTFFLLVAIVWGLIALWPSQGCGVHHFY